MASFRNGDVDTPGIPPTSSASLRSSPRTENSSQSPGYFQGNLGSVSQILSNTRIILITVALNLSIFLVALDSVIITTILPTISTQFSISDTGYAWTGSAYLLTNASSIPVWGKVSDVFGRKPIVLVANVIFLAGSLISALSVGTTMLIAGRAVQGLGGGGIVILVHICVADLFSIRERGLHLGILGAVWAVASAIGPVLGGTFAEMASWRWCFYINLPIDGIAFLILFFSLNIHNPRTAVLSGIRAIDWPGAVTISGGTVMLLLGLQFGGTIYPWSSVTVVCLITFGFLTYGLFFVTQWKISPYPTMPLRIFSDLSNLSALGVCFCDSLVFQSVAYFTPLYFQTVLAASPLQSGVWMLSLAIPLTVFSLSTGFVIERTGRYLELLRFGLCSMTLGIGLFINFPPFRSWVRIVVYLMIVGLGFGPNFHAPLIALQSRTALEDIAAATATFGFARMISGSLGVVLGQVVIQSRMKEFLDDFLAAGINPELAKLLTGGSAISSTTAVAGLDPALQKFVKFKFTRALASAWIFYTVISGLGLLVSFGIQKQKLNRLQESKPEVERTKQCVREDKLV